MEKFTKRQMQEDIERISKAGGHLTIEQLKKLDAMDFYAFDFISTGAKDFDDFMRMYEQDLFQEWIKESSPYDNLKGLQKFRRDKKEEMQAMKPYQKGFDDYFKRKKALRKKALAKKKSS